MRSVIDELCRRFAVVSESELRVDGRLEPAVVPAGSPWADVLLETTAMKAIAQRIYDEAYAGREPAPALRRKSRVGPDELVEDLSAANAGTGCDDSGWQVEEQVPPDHVRVAKYGLTFVAPASDVTRSLDSSVCRVRVRKELRWLNPGFYMALGNAVPEPGDAETRVYLHATEACAVPLMAGLTKTLNAAGLPFRFKIVSAPEGYTRADAAVLYVPRALFASAMAALRPVYETVRPALRPTTPLFTLRLGAGIAVADDTGVPGESFGQSRCRLIAEGLWRARDVDSPENRTRAVRERLFEASLDLDRLHLRVRGAAEYEPTALAED